MKLLHVKLMPPDCHVSVLKHVEMFSVFMFQLRLYFRQVKGTS